MIKIKCLVLKTFVELLIMVVMGKIIMVEKNVGKATEFLQIWNVKDYQVEIVLSDEHAYLLYNRSSAEMIVLDNDCPEVYFILKEIRRTDPEVFIVVKGIPLIKGEIEMALELGADHYIPYVAPREIKACLKAWVRRMDHRKKEYKLNAQVRLSLLSQRLYLPDGVQILNEGDCKILELLARNKGKLVDTETLVRACWAEVNADTRTYLSKSIKRLRELLGEDSGLIIGSLRGRGYILEDKEEF